MYFEDTAEAASEEALVELSDYCARALAYLGSDQAHQHAAVAGARAWAGGEGGSCTGTSQCRYAQSG